MKYVPEFAKFMLDNGLIFEINRRVLHPLGLALVMDVQEDDNETVFVKGLWIDDDMEGIVFDEETYEHGRGKYRKFFEAHGRKRYETRFEGLGFIVQLDPKVLPRGTKDGVVKIDFVVCLKHGDWYTQSLDVPEEIAKRGDRELVAWAWKNHFVNEGDDIVHVGIYWDDPKVQNAES
jgi:hypothetical protein